MQRLFLASLVLLACAAAPPQADAQAQAPAKSRPAEAAYAAKTAAPPKLDDILAEYRPEEGLGAVVFTPAGVRDIVYVGLSGVSRFPVERIGGDKKAFVVFTDRLDPGRYDFIAVASNETGELGFKKFTVVKPGEIPPPPPPPPPVTDPLVQALQAAYDGDAGTLAEKAAALKDLADLHGRMTKYTADKSLSTVGQMVGVIHDAVVAQLGDRPDGKLIAVRTAVAKEEAKLFPFPDSKALTDAMRSDYAKFYARVSAALRAVKGVR